MQPYQKATDRVIQQGRQQVKNIGTGVALATGTLVSRVAPFLSEFVPWDMALKGISKINPTLGRFIKNAQNEGYDGSEIKNFIQDKIRSEASGQEQQQQQQEKQKPVSDNPIEQMAPDLHNHLIQEVSKGRKPLEALHAAKGNQGLLAQVEAIAKTLKNNLFSVLERYYNPEALGIAGQSKAALQPLNQAFQNVPPQEPPAVAQQEQMGPGAQALMAILQKINQKRGG